jgi:hypothetical protein
LFEATQAALLISYLTSGCIYKKQDFSGMARNAIYFTSIMTHKPERPPQPTFNPEAGAKRTPSSEQQL